MQETCSTCFDQIHADGKVWVDNSGGDICGGDGANSPHKPSVDWVVEWAINESAGSPLEAAERTAEQMREGSQVGGWHFTVHGDVPMPDGTVELQQWSVDLSTAEEVRITP